MTQKLTDAGLLDVWERGRTGAAAERLMLLVAAATPELSEERRSQFSISECNAAILRLRRATFGADLPGRVDCPACGERQEFALDAAQLLPDQAAPLAREFTVGTDLRFRLPTGRDLLALACCPDPDTAARRLMELCCLDPETPKWSPALIAEIETQIAALEEGTEITLQFACVACGHDWTEHLDVGGYFWEEIETRAQQLMDEVHRLAWCYGWDEQPILAMSHARRTAYLERCDA